MLLIDIARKSYARLLISSKEILSKVLSKAFLFIFFVIVIVFFFIIVFFIIVVFFVFVFVFFFFFFFFSTCVYISLGSTSTPFSKCAFLYNS